MPSEGELRAEDLHWKLRCSILCTQPRSQDLHPVAVMETCCICRRRAAHHLRSGRGLRWHGAGKTGERGAGTRIVICAFRPCVVGCNVRIQMWTRGCSRSAISLYTGATVHQGVLKQLSPDGWCGAGLKPRHWSCNRQHRLLRGEAEDSWHATGPKQNPLVQQHQQPCCSADQPRAALHIAARCRTLVCCTCPGAVWQHTRRYRGPAGSGGGHIQLRWRPHGGAPTGGTPDHGAVWGAGIHHGAAQRPDAGAPTQSSAHGHAETNGEVTSIRQQHIARGVRCLVRG